MLWIISQIDKSLAKKVADNLGMKIPKSIEKPINQAIGADTKPKDQQPGNKKNYLEESPELSQSNTKFNSIATRQIAVLVANGFSMKSFKAMKKVMDKENAMVKIIAPHGGTIKCDTEMEHKVDASIMTTESVLFDAIHIPGGEKSVKALMENAKFTKFVKESFKHCKAIAADGEGSQLLEKSSIPEYRDDEAIFVDGKPADFVDAIAKHRNWNRRKIAEKISV